MAHYTENSYEKNKVIDGIVDMRFAELMEIGQMLYDWLHGQGLAEALEEVEIAPTEVSFALLDWAQNQYDEKEAGKK